MPPRKDIDEREKMIVSIKSHEITMIVTLLIRGALLKSSLRYHYS